MELQEAHEVSGVSERTLRQWIKTGKLKATMRTTERGRRWDIDPESLLSQPLEGNGNHWKEAETKAEESEGEICGCGCANEIKRLEQLVAAHQEQTAVFREQLQVKDAQIGELHILLQQSQTALPAPKPRRRWWPWGRA